MEEQNAIAVETAEDVQRVVGHLGAGQPGPKVVITCVIHGNERSGLLAARRVLRRIEQQQLRLHGQILVLAGNLQALSQGRRFIDRDLNRQWSAERIRVARRRADSGQAPAEDREQFELLDRFREYAEGESQLYFIDLHTSSAEGAPFLTVGDTLRNRRFALGLPLPIILGLEEQVDGSLLEYLNNRGCITLGVEAGQHDAPSSVDRHAAVLWLALTRTGSLDPDSVDLQPSIELLQAASEGIPPVMEVRHRHVLHPDDRFKMEPGYTNFQAIADGELLAHDAKGPIHARERSRILLPLYQGQGDDGFFLCREVEPFWLGVSAAMRRIGLPQAMTLLPGVRRHPDQPNILLVNLKVARFFQLQLFHLLGYRKLRNVGNLLMVSRRRHDREAPTSIRFED